MCFNLLFKQTHNGSYGWDNAKKVRSSSFHNKVEAALLIKLKFLDLSHFREHNMLKVK